MKKQIYAFVMFVTIAQTDVFYACDAMRAENPDCRELSFSHLQPINFEEKLIIWSAYSKQRQQEMRNEANDLRPSFESASNVLLSEISSLTSEKQNVFFNYTRVGRTIQGHKVDTFFKSVAVKGEFLSFDDLLHSLVLIGIVMHKKITEEQDKIACEINARNIQIQNLPHYGLFHSEVPTCQLRTKFIVMHEIINMLKPRVSASSLKENEIKKTLEKGESLFVDFSACNEKLKDKGQEMSHACAQSDWERVSMLTNEISHLATELENIKKQQDELAKKVSLLKTELQIIGEQKNQTEDCLRLNVAELKECAEFANNHVKALENNKLRYNTLTCQDQIFLTEMLGFLRENYS